MFDVGCGMVQVGKHVLPSAREVVSVCRVYSGGCLVFRPSEASLITTVVI